MVILDHIGRLQRFVIDRVVLLDERQCGFMMEVVSLSRHLLMGFGEQCHGFAPPVAAMLAPTHPALGSFKGALGFKIPAGVEDACTI
jgi:hypothetical protein